MILRLCLVFEKLKEIDEDKKQRDRVEGNKK